jgi:hypothetical protein
LAKQFVEETLIISSAKIEVGVKFPSKETGRSDNDFNRLFLEAVDSGFSLLGESAKQATYFHLEKDFRIARGDIPRRIDDFANALEEMFGFGAKFIEVQIMRKLYENVRGFKYVLKKEDIVFTEYVAAIRKYCSHQILC